MSFQLDFSATARVSTRSGGSSPSASQVPGGAKIHRTATRDIVGNVCVTIQSVTVREFLDRGGSSPFAKWFGGLDATAAAKVTTALLRIELGNLSNVKGVGAGVFEYRIDFGPGYRVYFGKDGETVVILLGGGTKKRQDRDIATAKERWKDYKERRSQEK